MEQSLVTAEPDVGGGETRYGVLEPVRQYALERLHDGGEEEEARLRHAEHYLAVAERAGPKLIGP